MEYITLEEVKEHLIIDKDFSDDDRMIKRLIRLSIDFIQRYYDLDFEVITSENNEILPETIIQGMLLTIGDYYENRTTISNSSITPKNIVGINRIMDCWIKIKC